jgi:hypothetical protein
MEDDLIASLDIIEPPRKKFKRLVHQDQPSQSHTCRVSKRRYHPCFIKNIPREILKEILDYLDTQTIYFLTIACHHFKASNLWGSITKLDTLQSVRVPIYQIVGSIDRNRLTKLRFRVDTAISHNYLARMLRFTNIISLDINTRNTPKSTAVNLLLYFPSLRDLTTTIKLGVLKNFHGKYLTKLDILPYYDFDVSPVSKFKQLEVLKISSGDAIDELTNAASLSQLTRLTSLSFLTVINISKSDFKAICRLTQLQHLESDFHLFYSPKSVSRLHNLTTLKLKRSHRVEWTNILPALTKLQHISVEAIGGKFFSPCLCSTLKHLETVRFTDDVESHISQLTSLQSLKVIAPNDPSIYIQLRELQRLTSLILQFVPESKMESPYWTALTQISCLNLENAEYIDGKFLKQTKNQMPSVQVKWSKPPKQPKLPYGYY